MATEVGALSRVLSLRTWIRPNSSILDTHGARGCASDISGPLTVFSLCGEQVRGVVTVLAPEPWPEQEGDGWNSLDLEAQPRHSASSHPACHPFSFLYAPLCMWPTFARTKVPVLLWAQEFWSLRNGSHWRQLVPGRGPWFVTAIQYK